MSDGAVISATLYSDPACPWAYSESPALRVMEWRYGAQISWRLVLVGLSEDSPEFRSGDPALLRRAVGQIGFRDRYGMPFAPGLKRRRAASSRACRAVIATRREYPGREWAVFRALQLANFTTALLFDVDAEMVEVIASVPGVDAKRVVGLIDDPEVQTEYEDDKAETRSAAGSPTELQGKSGRGDGAVRYTAPSVVFTRAADGLRLEAGGFQPVEAYDVLVANLDPTLDRRAPPEDPAPLLTAFPGGLTTQEVAALMTRGNDTPDRRAAEAALFGLADAGAAERHPLGDDALWTPPGGPGSALRTARG